VARSTSSSSGCAARGKVVDGLALADVSHEAVPVVLLVDEVLATFLTAVDPVTARATDWTRHWHGWSPPSKPVGSDTVNHLVTVDMALRDSPATVTRVMNHRDCLVRAEVVATGRGETEIVRPPASPLHELMDYTPLRPASRTTDQCQ
jgi:hypothetical protein